MAATPSKPSPTSKPVQQTSLPEGQGGTIDQFCKETPIGASPPHAPNDNSEDTEVVGEHQVQPTYESSEQSDYFQAAKQLLSDGDFEQALVTIQEALETTKSYLESSVALATPEDTAAVELHESLAPLHYLYGTTLLYSVEESTDSQQMTVGQDGSAEDGQATDKGIELFADDMQIAWENLDAARTILELMLSSDDEGIMPPVRKTRLQLALSQVLFREGDLQRLNGRYLEAIQDYDACLQLRQKILGQDQFHRQIASTFYNLGLTYLTSSSELTKQSMADDEQTDVENKFSMDASSREKLSEEHRVKGISCYLECAKVFCGTIALACGADPQEIITGVRIGEDGVPRAGLKTTGLDDQYRETQSSSNESLALSAMRRRVSGLTATAAGDNTINELKQILDEIQETVDEAAVSQEAVRQASEMKMQAQKAVANSDPLDGEEGVTSTIGFGDATVRSSQSVAVAATNDSEAPAKPMMVIKKKKKRDAPVDEKSGASAIDDADSKRARTE